MDPYKRHHICWRIAYRVLLHPLEWIFALQHENVDLAKPCLVISNHVTDYDPMLLALSFPHNDLYFVASEHLFRKGLISRLLQWAMAPISRRKGSQGTDTVKACLRHLREGRSVCIFAEGDATWDGRTGRIFPATAKLARASGASLMTYRLEGGYLSKPRWSRTRRRGKIHGHPVAVYSPEQLRDMRSDEINRAIERDIWEDAWARQREEHIAFRGKRLAEGLELALFCCPSCERLGTLRTREDRLFCDCGFSVQYSEEGFFVPPEPFSSVADWEDWQQEELKKRPVQAGESLFSDEGVSLRHIESGHREETLGIGRLVQLADQLVWDARSFPLDKIDNMAMVQKHLLLFSYEGEYYELRAESGVNLRKYLSWWKNVKVGQE